MSTMRLIDPPKRPGWVQRLSPQQRTTALLREYLASRVGCKDAKESSACRRMLGSLGRIQADGNAAGVELNIVKGPGHGIVLMFFYIPGVGPIDWLPQLVTGANLRLQHVMREGAPGFQLPLEPPVSASRESENKGARRIPPRPETRLIPGRQGL